MHDPLSEILPKLDGLCVKAVDDMLIPKEVKVYWRTERKWCHRKLFPAHQFKHCSRMIPNPTVIMTVDTLYCTEAMRDRINEAIDRAGLQRPERTSGSYRSFIDEPFLPIQPASSAIRMGMGFGW